MFSQYKQGDKVIVYGFGECEGKFYKNVPAIIIERDPYYKDFNVKFSDGTEDWVLEESLRKPYQTKKGNKNIWKLII